MDLDLLAAPLDTGVVIPFRRPAAATRAAISGGAIPAASAEPPRLMGHGPPGAVWGDALTLLALLAAALGNAALLSAACGYPWR